MIIDAILAIGTPSNDDHVSTWEEAESTWRVYGAASIEVLGTIRRALETSGLAVALAAHLETRAFRTPEERTRYVKTVDLNDACDSALKEAYDRYAKSVEHRDTDAVAIIVACAAIKLPRLVVLPWTTAAKLKLIRMSPEECRAAIGMPEDKFTPETEYVRRVIDARSEMAVARCESPCAQLMLDAAEADYDCPLEPA